LIRDRFLPMKKKILFMIKLLVTALVVAVIIKKVDFSQIKSTFVHPNLFFLSLASILMLLNFGLKFLKWHYLLQTCSIRETFIDASKSYLAGLAMGIVTPARAGEVGRALFLKNRERLKGSGVAIVDKIFDLIGIVLLSLCGAQIFISPGAYIFLLMFVVGGIVLLLFSGSFHTLLTRFLPGGSLGSKVKQIFTVLDHLSARVVLTNLLITVVMFFVVLLQCYFLVKTFHHPAVSFNSILFAYPLVIVANILPITIGGLGVREGVAVFTLSIFNIPGDVAVSATLYLFLINLVLPALLGALVIVGSNRVN